MMAIFAGVCHAVGPEDEKTYREKVVPFLKNYCMDCHSGAEATADFDVTSYKSAHQLTTSGRKQWNTVLDMLTTGEMPPEDGEQPPEEEMLAVRKWIEEALSKIDCDGDVNPGRETIRRLNRIEYQNTVRDLLGVEFEATKEFPADDVGYGFDNIGDVLSLSPLLLEKYYQAADEITRQAIVTDPVDLLPKKAVNLADFKFSKKGKPNGNQLSFPTNESASVDVEFMPGEHKILIHAYGSRGGDELPKMGVKIDRIDRTMRVSATRGASKIHEVTGRFRKGTHKLEVSFLNDFYDPDAEDPTQRDRNLYITKIEIQGPLRVSADMYPESHKRIFFVEPKPAQLTEENAASQILSRFASRAFRRPVTGDEMRRLMILYQLARKDEYNHEAAVREAILGILCSSHFLFKVEMGPDEGTRELNDFELATRMSYFLWSTMPDDRLLALAWKGQLRQNLDTEIDRMLADPRSSALVQNFGGQWLELRSLDSITPDSKQFKTFNKELAAAMRTETEMFFESILREDRSVLDLIRANYTFLNEPLAKHYQISGVSGDEFKRVTLTSDKRGGLLTHASVLTVTSNPTRTSPVKRGKWILENILGTPPPEAPPEVPSLESQKKLTGSLREQMKQHRDNPSCASCHARMDPIGFALENYDAIGVWRDKDGEHGIDPSGELPGGIQFAGSQGLKQLILEHKQKEFVRTLTDKMMTYALGRGLDFYDECAVQEVQQALATHDHKFSALVRSIIKSRPFQIRSAK